MAAAATECSHGYDGLRGAATAVVRPLSSSPGRRRLCAYFDSQALTSASCMATFIMAKPRMPLPPGMGFTAEMSVMTSFH